MFLAYLQLWVQALILLPVVAGAILAALLCNSAWRKFALRPSIVSEEPASAVAEAVAQADQDEEAA